MTIILAAGLAGAGILAETVAFGRGYVSGEDREAMSMYLAVALMAAGVLALAALAGAGSFPEALLGPDWIPAAVLPVAGVSSAALIAVCFLPEHPGSPSRWFPAGLCAVCLSLALLSFG